MLSDEQSAKIKKQLMFQLDKSNIPNKEDIKNAVQAMDNEQLEEFLKQNRIKVTQKQKPQSTSIESPKEVQTEEKSESKTQQCIFCEIANNRIPSYKIAENKNAIAVLEINPLSKGHSLVIPVAHKSLEKLPNSIMNLAKKVSKKIKSKLKPEEIKIETTEIQGHPIINIIPIYKDQKLEKTKADEKQLILLQDKLKAKAKSENKEKVKSKAIKPENLSKLPIFKRRIP